MGWIDTLVVIIIVVVGLMIFYRALKEPIDLLVNGIKKLFGGMKDKVSNMSDESGGFDEIKYG